MQRDDPSLVFFAERLRVALAKANIRPSELARACGVTAMAVTKWTSGRSAPRSSHLVIAARMTGASMDWLCVQEPVDIRSWNRTEDDADTCDCGATTKLGCRRAKCISMCPFQDKTEGKADAA